MRARTEKIDILKYAINSHELWIAEFYGKNFSILVIGNL